jgi:hypothetical protein
VSRTRFRGWRVADQHGCCEWCGELICVGAEIRAHANGDHWHPECYEAYLRMVEAAGERYVDDFDFVPYSHERPVGLVTHRLQKRSERQGQLKLRFAR